MMKFTTALGNIINSAYLTLIVSYDFKKRLEPFDI